MVGRASPGAKQKMIGTKIVVSGFDRLAKVIPTTGIRVKIPARKVSFR